MNPEHREQVMIALLGLLGHGQMIAHDKAGARPKGGTSEVGRPNSLANELAGGGRTEHADFPFLLHKGLGVS